MESNSRQPFTTHNASNTIQASTQLTHNVSPYYSVSTQHNDTVLFNQHGVPQYPHVYPPGVLPYPPTPLPMHVNQQGVPLYPPNSLSAHQYGIIPHQYNIVPINQHGIAQNTHRMPLQQTDFPVNQQGVPLYPPNSLSAHQYGIFPHQYNTVPINQYGIGQSTHRMPPQQTEFHLHQHGVPLHPWNTQHTIRPSFSIPSTPHPLATGGTYLNPSPGFYSSQESITANPNQLQPSIHPTSSSPNLRYPSLTYQPGIELHTRNYESESTNNTQVVSQQQTFSLINTSPSNNSLVERNIHSLPNENVHLPLTVQSDNELPNIDPSLTTTMKQQLSATSLLHRSPSISSTDSQNVTSLGTPPAKRIRVDNSLQIAASSDHDDSNDSDNSQQDNNEEDNSLQVDYEISDDQLPSVAMSSQAISASDQFTKIYEKVFPACAKWYNLGLALGVDTGTLDAIKLTHNNECGACVRETLKKINQTKNLSWTDIVTALKNPIVGQNALADSIQREFVQETTSQSSSEPSIVSFPECVCEYASFLKRKYKKMPTFPDDWPPRLKDEKFLKLALIERSQQIQLPQAKRTESIQYDYATGNNDNIIARKQEITLENIFSLPPGNSTNNEPYNFIVLMDGAPGVGKTTLTRKICIDWAEGNLLTDHQIVILKPMREMRDHTTTSLSDILVADDPELKEEVIKHIQKTSGSGVMFIFDGFDELSSEQQDDTNTLFRQMIDGNKFDKCSVLVTSRTYASDPIQEINRVNRHVEVLGFKEEDIQRCIKQNITDKKKAQTLLQMLKTRLDIVSLCYIPLSCRIVLYVYQQLGTLPDTLTQLYEKFILHTIKHYKNKISVIKDKTSIQQANSMELLPKQVMDYLNDLSKVAYVGIDENKLVFEYAELQTDANGEINKTLELGLLNTIGELVPYYYQFLHLTIQEFLAAKHLASWSNEELLRFFETNLFEKRFRMTLIFLSGLTQLQFFSPEKVISTQKKLIYA